MSANWIIMRMKVHQNNPIEPIHSHINKVKKKETKSQAKEIVAKVIQKEPAEVHPRVPQSPSSFTGGAANSTLNQLG